MLLALLQSILCNTCSISYMELILFLGPWEALDYWFGTKAYVVIFTMALLLPIAQGRQLMTSRDDMNTEDRLVIDSRLTPPTPVISEADKRSPQPMSGSFDALLQKYGAGCAVDSERGTGAAPLSMDLQLLQQCVEKSLTAAQKAPSLASLGATHELRNPALAFHRPSLVSVSTSDVTSVPPTDGQKTFSCQICSSFTGKW